MTTPDDQRQKATQPISMDRFLKTINWLMSRGYIARYRNGFKITELGRQYLDDCDIDDMADLEGQGT